VGRTRLSGVLILNTLVSIPLNVVPTRVSMIRLLGLATSERVSEGCGRAPLRHLLTLALLACLASVAMVLDSVADIISFLSGAICTVIAFLLPFWFYKRSEIDAEAPAVRTAVLAALGLATVAGFANVVVLMVSKATESS